MPDPIFDFYTLVGFMSLGLAGYFALFLLRYLRVDVANGLLGFMVAILFFNLFHDVLTHSRLLLKIPWAWGLGGSLNSFLGVLAFLYVLQVNGKLQASRVLAHLVLPTVYFGWRVYEKLNNTPELNHLVEYYLGQSTPQQQWEARTVYHLVMNLLLVGIYLFYAWKSRVEAPATKKPWVTRVIVLASLQFWVTLTMVVLEQTSNYLYGWNIAISALIAQMMFLGYFLIQYPVVTLSGDSTAIRYSSSQLSPEKSKAYLRQLQSLMEGQQIYKDPNLSIRDVSKSLDIYANYLSQAINQNLGINFNEFVNQYRVAAAREMLENRTFDRYTVEAIAFEAGFNSKSSYYRAFQKVTGKSPAAYKRGQGK